MYRGAASRELGLLSVVERQSSLVLAGAGVVRGRQCEGGRGSVQPTTPQRTVGRGVNKETKATWHTETGRPATSLPLRVKCPRWRTLHPAPTPSACSSTPGGCLSSRTVLSHSSTFVSQTPRPGASKERPPPSFQLRALETCTRPPGGGVGVKRAGPPRRPQRSVQRTRTHGAPRRVRRRPTWRPPSAHDESVLSIVSAWSDGEQAGDRDNKFRESERGAHQHKHSDG